MALSVTSVVPTTGHSGGKFVLQIEGVDFRLPVAPAPVNGVTPEAPVSVRVFIGGLEASNVGVASSGVLYCSCPKGDPDGGALDLLVQNVADDGTVLESSTLAAAFTFQRPDLTEESELARVMRALMEELKLQVHPNVHFSTHTDYDDATGDALNYTYVGKPPALVLGNLEAPENREHHHDEGVELAAGSGRFIERRPPLAVDLSMTLVGVTDNPITILNLMQAVRMFFKKNAWLRVERVEGDPTNGFVEYEMDWSFGGPVSVTHQGEGNMESFGGRIVLRGVLLEDMPGVSKAKPAGIPAHLPHEATTRYGWTTPDAPSAVQIGDFEPLVIAPETDGD